MPKDINGIPLKDDDEVLVRGRVIGTAPSEEGPNLVVTLLGGKEGDAKVNVAINSRMAKKIDEIVMTGVLTSAAGQAPPPPAPPLKPAQTEGPAPNPPAAA